MTHRPGILPDWMIRPLLTTREEPRGIEPSSLDISPLKTKSEKTGVETMKIWRMPFTGLPGQRPVEDMLKAFSIPETLLCDTKSDNQVLSPGETIIVEADIRIIPEMLSDRIKDEISKQGQDLLTLPVGHTIIASPRSSIGRLDLFVRVLFDHTDQYDTINRIYGPTSVYLEITTLSFPILISKLPRLVQFRIQTPECPVLRTEDVRIALDVHHHAYKALKKGDQNPITFSSSESGKDYFLRHQFSSDMSLHGNSIVMQPDHFYIMSTRDLIQIGIDECAQMAGYAESLGEWRAHYAGFFDPGFGLYGPTRGVVEVRCHSMPAQLVDGNRVARLVYYPMAARPEKPYGQGNGRSDSYQNQKTRLSRYLKTDF